MRHRKFLPAVAAAGALVLSALPAVATPEAVDLPPPEGAEEPRKKPTGQVAASDGTESAEAGDRVDRQALASTLAADDERGTYIVQFHSPAVPAYTGGVNGLTATASADGFDPSSAAVEAYQDHLEAEQDAGLGAVEAELGRKVSVVDTYDLAINGAAIDLEPAEAAALAMVPELAYIEREPVFELTSDAGPAHLGAEAIWDGAFAGADPDTAYKGEGAVVGILDTGISPENPSFAGEGPVDGYVHDWSGDYLGACDPDSAQYEDDFPCNDKLIGAYGFPAGAGARDGQDHGTHTSSTAAGNVVDIELGPEGNEQELTISGVAPHAHLISYAVCTPSCLGSNILSAINQAIEDEVDVINYSIGGNVPSQNMWTESSNVAWLNANAAGIRIAHSAGNAGPGDATVHRSSDLPWVTSVGASEHNRAIENTLIDITADGSPALDDVIGKGFTGGLESGTPVVHDTNDPHCYNPDAGVVEGMIVLCDRGGPSPIGRVQSSENAAAAGAVGFVLMNAEAQADSVHGDEFALPGVHVSHAHGQVLKDLVASSDQVTAGVAGYEFNYDNPYTDYQASFSSRGPSGAASTLVPNITAPGLDIIAAYGSYVEGEAPPVEWGVMSGTSMSSPHIAGVYGLMAQVRADWSPAETRSALQLTARSGMPKEDGSLGDPHSEGSGYGDVATAVESGFVMDITEDDFWAADPDEDGDPRQLNFAELVNFEQGTSFTWDRALTSTQSSDVTYTVDFDGDPGLDLEAPDTITLAAGATEQVELTATTGADVPIGMTLYGQVTLTSDADVPDAHLPVVVTTVEPEVNLNVDPDAISTVLEPGEAHEATVTVSNTGNEAFTWVLADQGSGAIWDQPIDGTSGIVSDRFIDGVDDSGVFAADDFTVGDDGTAIESIFTPGFWAPTYPGALDDAHRISWYIYPDDGGAPAGHPDDGQNLEVWSYTAEPGADGVFINDDEVTLNLAAAGQEALELAAGDYWLSVFPDVDENPESLNDRWNWYNGTANGTSAMLADPDGLFGPAGDQWQDFASVGIDWSGLAFTLSGSYTCTVPDDVGWLNVDPVTGELNAGETDEVAISFDATGLDHGTYMANLCFGTDDPTAPVASVAVEMEVTAFGSIDGTVNDAETDEAIEGASVIVDSLDLATTTDADGNYEFPEVPIGTHEVVANAGGYAADGQDVDVAEGQTTTADFALGSLPPMIGILDSGSGGAALGGVLDDYGLPHEPFAWGDDPSNYSIVLVNNAGDPGEDVFTEFVDAADHAGTGLVMLDTWSGTTGVELLHTHLGNPEQRGDGWGDGELSYEVTSDHPIVEGYDIGQEIMLDVSSSDFDYAWFDGYTGDNVTLIADALAGGEALGRGIAVDDRGSSRHVLMSMHGASGWVGPQYWEGGGVQVFLNALDWASDEIDVADPELVEIVVEPAESEIEVGETVELSATAVYSNFPDVDVTGQATWASSDENVATVDAGDVTGIAAGDASITATYEGASSSANVTVLHEGPLISVGPESLHVEVAEGGEADTALTVSNTGDKDLVWELFAAESVEASSTVTGEPTVLPGASGSATVGDLSMSTQRTSGSDEPQRFTHDFDAAQDQVTITHSESQDVVELNSAACGSIMGTSENSYLRTFTLDDFGIADEFDVTEVQFGVELHAGPAVTGDVTVYQLNAGDDFVYGNLVERGSAEVTLDDSLTGQIVTVPVSSDEAIEAGATLVVEVSVPEVSAIGGGFYIGSNPDGQTAPSYIASSECGMVEPTDTAEIDFADMHIVMNVTGDAGPAACDTPADIGWLSTDPGSGTTAPGESDEVTVTVDASDLAIGTHDAVLCVSSNAANTDLVPVPLTVEVTELEVAIGVAGDHDGQIGAWLDSQGIAHEPFALGDDPEEFSAVLVNEPADPGRDAFSEFIAETDAAGVGVVMLDSFSPGNRLMGIELGAEYLGNPGDRHRKQGGGSVSTLAYEVTESHPVVGDATPGEVINHDVSSQHSPHAWFADYAGTDVTAVANVLVDGDTVGQGIAVDDRETNNHVLLSLHGATKFSGPGDWTDDTQQVMVNALEHASH